MDKVKIGWGEVSIVPEGRKVNLAGQFYERITDEVETPISITALALECGGEAAIFCSCDLVSRSVARDASYQKFDSLIVGNAPCTGHTECDAIIMDSARVLAVPQLDANNIDASLIHEAAIGKIAGEQLIKLMTLGLSEAEAEEQIIQGFLK